MNIQCLLVVVRHTIDFRSIAAVSRPKSKAHQLQWPNHKHKHHSVMGVSNGIICLGNRICGTDKKKKKRRRRRKREEKKSLVLFNVPRDDDYQRLNGQLNVFFFINYAFCSFPKRSVLAKLSMTSRFLPAPTSVWEQEICLIKTFPNGRDDERKHNIKIIELMNVRGFSTHKFIVIIFI